MLSKRPMVWPSSQDVSAAVRAPTRSWIRTRFKRKRERFSECRIGDVPAVHVVRAGSSGEAAVNIVNGLSKHSFCRAPPEWYPRFSEQRSDIDTDPSATYVLDVRVDPAADKTKIQIRKSWRHLGCLCRSVSPWIENEFTEGVDVNQGVYSVRRRLPVPRLSCSA